MSKQGIARLLHTTILRNQILVGPPHPLSNLRLVLYNGVLEDHSKTNAYSPNELQSHVPTNPDKFQLDTSMKSLDKLNHDFWAEVSMWFCSILTLF
jgi:Apoptogenic protein 1